MSKRPSAAANMPSNRGGLGGYLRDRPIWVKLGLIMMVPTIATLVVGVSALVTNLGDAHTANTVKSVTALSRDVGALVDALQAERVSAASVLGDTRATADVRAAELTQYKSLFAATDAAARAYTQQRRSLSGLSGEFEATLTSVDGSLATLADMRQGTTTGVSLPNDAKNRYTTLISGLLDLRTNAALLTNDAELTQELQAGVALARFKESLAQVRMRVDAIILQGVVNTEDIRELLQQDAEQNNYFSIFGTLASSSQRDYYQTTTEEGTNSRWKSYEAQATDLTVGALLFEFPSKSNWDDAMDAQLARVRVAEKTFDAQAYTDASALNSDVHTQLLIEAAVLLILVVVTVMVAWFMARSMARALRELRHGALSIAQFGLPQAVARLRDPSLNTSLAPHLLASQIAEPLPVRSRDEFGQVTEAFNAVHLEAVRTAAEQAALRASVSTMFVNLARRSQILVDRLIGHLDRLERGEEDPDRLAELFQLDHLATRMRRNDENLLVLAGADSTRVQREPAALIDVLRAAQSEVEHYTRIEFGVIDRDLEIAAHAVNDLVHLVAELFDNATAFSPPDSTVIVEARRVGDRAVLYVEDHGIGISPDQLADLNNRLGTPPQVDVAVSRMMGLVVVARLAARHGVKVELRPAHERGTIADVLLPTAVLVPRALAGRAPTGGIAGAPPTPPPTRPAADQPPPPRSPFGTPLALESGPTSLTGNGFAGSAFDPGVHGAGSASRHLPPWSDLTGASSTPAGTNGTDLYGPRNGSSNDHPLPQRRATEAEPDGVPDGGPEWDDPASRPNIPRQTSASPEMRATTAPDFTEQPAAPHSAAWMAAAEAIDADLLDLTSGGPVAHAPVSAPPHSAPPYSAPPQSALPSWPPTAPMNDAPAEPADDEPVAPQVPEKFVAALDITSEIPRVRGAEPAVEVPSVPQGYASPTVPGAPQREPVRVIAHADETMELPIFRELESAWFRARPDASPEEPEQRLGTVQTDDRPGDVEYHATAPASMVDPAESDKPMASVAGRSTGTPAFGAGDRMPAVEPSWHTAADDGWLAASAAAAPLVAQTTESGLPKRTPMAQLVPGGVEKNSSGASKRSPEQVRGLLSAYHRGVQRGRSRGDDANSPEQNPASGNSPHGGKEQGA